MTASTTLRDLLEADSTASLQTDDVLFLVLPLMRSVAQLHAHGRVADMNGGGDVLCNPNGTLALRRPEGVSPVLRTGALRTIQPPPSSTLNIVGEARVTIDAEGGIEGQDLRVQRAGTSETLQRPVYLPDFACWELMLGHHDEITDIFQLGQILACLACGLSFYDADDLELFAAHRNDLFRLNRRLNPVVATVIVEMTALNRHDRATDLAEIVQRLETWRDQPATLDVERVLSDARGPLSRRATLLSHLRDRLFDLSRRNRLLHFRPTQASTNLTVASVPLVMQIQSIKPEQIATWDSTFSADILSGSAVSLQKWLRFEDQPDLAPTLDRILQETRRDRAEYGFSNLRLVVAFLRWHDLKEDPDSRIVSPLLWLPVELHKRKGVRDQFVLSCTEQEAEFNPALRHWLRQLYDIQLPETIDLGKLSLESIHADLQAQIHRSEPGVELRLLHKPSIQLIHQKAMQRIEQFKRRRQVRERRRSTPGMPDFSYAADDFRPLGLAWFRRDIEHRPLPLRSAVGGAIPRHPSMAAGNVAEASTYALHEDPGHRYAWDLDLTQVTLANFNYKKMSLVSDYNQLIDERLDVPAFDRVFSIEPRPVDTQAPPTLPLNDRWSVVAGDRTQNAAVELARTGRSFIIQGPPGTGKSQTITNLIADFSARNRRVLFVCEKRAALDVVFHRLKQSGLEALCCLIHDSQTDKKAFVSNLRDGYEKWIRQPNERELRATARGTTLASLNSALSRIEGFDQAMSAAPDSVAHDVRSLLRRLIELGPSGLELTASQREALPDHRSFVEHRDLIGRLHAYVRERFGLQSLAEHPFRFIHGNLLMAGTPIKRIEAALDEAERLLDELQGPLDDDAQLLTGQTSLAEAAALTQTLRILSDAQAAAHPQLLDEQSPETAAFTQELLRVRKLTETASQTVSKNLQWREKLAPEETQSTLGFVKLREGSFLRWFMPSWWRVRGVLLRAYDFTPHVVKPTFRTILESLAEEHAAHAVQRDATQALQARYGIADAERFARTLETVRERIRQLPLLRTLRQKLAASPDPAREAREEARAEQPIAFLHKLLGASFRIDPATSLADIGEQLRDLRERLEDLPDFLPLLEAVHQTPEALKNLLLLQPYTPAPMETAVAWETLSRVQREYPELARFDEATLTQLTARAHSDQKAVLAQNAALIQATRHQRFLENVRQSSLSATQLDAEGKLFKKHYAAGRRELEHEFGKSMRYRAIRELASGDPGRVIDDLKPIWLMSPLSVSDTLPLRPDLFDVVIFDEASQIPMEEAVPALCRAPQVVIVGDEMQLPPTSFFASSSDRDAEVAEGSENERGVGITLDADSLLNQAARNLPATLLAWHYRSRYEALISFSNAAFYEGRLITIPDRSIESSGDDDLALRSDDQSSAAKGVDALLDRAISFHQISDGLYLARSNIPEATYIAGMVRELLMRDVKLSLGIVAFSEAQQSEIEAALDSLAEQDTTFAVRLEAEYTREDDGQFNGLFVKNLENVQGDERDIILLSICYGPGPDGRMLMNFGPINQRGGEKRLNVIFSRARHRMAVVSTIRAEAITNTHNDGAAALRSFLQFAYSSAKGDGVRAQSVLASLNAGAQVAFQQSAPRDALRQALARSLRARGHDVDEHVGRSTFRCDLALRDSSGNGYALGLLLDSASTTRDAQERYVFRPGILRAFGWKVLEVLSADWLSDSQRVIERIESVLAGDGVAEEESIDGSADAAFEAAATNITTPDVTTAAGESYSTREFRIQEGTSNKFWRIGVNGLDVVVVYGRVGSKGQVITKSFETLERAEREMAKLLAEKQRKGYIETIPDK